VANGTVQVTYVVARCCSGRSDHSAFGRRHGSAQIRYI